MNSSHKHHLKLVLGAVMNKVIAKIEEAGEQVGEEEVAEKVLEQFVKEIHESNKVVAVCDPSVRRATKLFNGLGGP